MKDFFVFALRSIKYRKLRTGLTVLGIIIGITAIVALISVSQGLENAIKYQFEKVGSNRVYLVPGATAATLGGMGEGLTDDDWHNVDSMPEVAWASPYVSGSDSVKFGNYKEFNQYIWGIETIDMDKRWSDIDLNLEEGRLFSGREKYSVIIGYRTAHDFFDKDIHINNKLEIKGKKFEVSGIMEMIGSEEDDYSIFMPLDIHRELFGHGDTVHVIEIKMKEGLDINSAAAEVERRLKRMRGNDDFDLFTPEQVLRQVSSVLSIVNIILGGIAAVSLVVGGIGIMNSMYTNVLERTREIGIMKSVGASNQDILAIFIIEAGTMGAIGGIVGAGLGWFIARMVEVIAKANGFMFMRVTVDWKLMLFAVAFAFILGLASGYLPAKQAAKLKPVESLRYGT